MTTFRLRGPVGADYNHDLDDVTAVNYMLNALGHFRVPDYGLTPYPDRPLFDGIQNFQKSNGLKTDGIMKPGGETERTLDGAARRFAENGAAPDGEGRHIHFDPAPPKSEAAPGGKRPGQTNDLSLDFIKRMYGPDAAIWGVGRTPSDTEHDQTLRDRDVSGPRVP
ncbi:MAG: peptidoglycan-binding domain-containing protein [Rhodospirillaceae bacterium]